MNVTFSNGTDAQQGVVAYVISNLLYLNLDRFGIDLDVEWVANPDPSVHNEFAETEVSGSSATVQLRLDFPNFAPTALWGFMEFAMETVAHELGHALFFTLTEADQDRILDLFGSDRDELDSDGDRAWEDRIREGIAETFKDAFLRQIDRKFSNRTNVKLPLSRYPEFRAIFRGALTTVGEPLPGLSASFTNLNAFSIAGSFVLEPATFAEIGLYNASFDNEFPLTPPGATTDDWRYRGVDMPSADWPDHEARLDVARAIDGILDMTVFIDHNLVAQDVISQSQSYYDYQYDLRHPGTKQDLVGDRFSVTQQVRVYPVWLTDLDTNAVMVDDYFENVEEFWGEVMFIDDDIRPQSAWGDPFFILDEAYDSHPQHSFVKATMDVEIPDEAVALAGVILGYRFRGIEVWNVTETGVWQWHTHAATFASRWAVSVSLPGGSGANPVVPDAEIPASALDALGVRGGPQRLKHPVVGA